MQVKKRDGKVVPFDREYIERAVTLAAAAAGEHDDATAQQVAYNVEATLTQAGDAIVDIEAIQDHVEQ